MATYTINFEQLTNFMGKLPEKLNKASESILDKSAKSMQKSIRTNAPPGFTGSLKKTKVKRFGKNRIQILGMPYARYVNEGIHPNKLLPIEAAEQHFQNPGSTTNKKLNIKNPKGWFLTAPSSQGKGFIDRSLSNFQKNAPRILKQEINRLIAP